MATVKTDTAVKALRGKVGNLVFRELNGKLIVQAAPVRKAPYNAAQLKQQNLFKEAMAYARTLLADPMVKAKYRAIAKAKGGSLNAFNVVVSEYMDGGVGSPRLAPDSYRDRSRFAYTSIERANRNDEGRIYAGENIGIMTGKQKSIALLLTSLLPRLPGLL